MTDVHNFHREDTIFKLMFFFPSVNGGREKATSWKRGFEMSNKKDAGEWKKRSEETSWRWGYSKDSEDGENNIWPLQKFKYSKTGGTFFWF